MDSLHYDKIASVRRCRNEGNYRPEQQKVSTRKHRKLTQAAVAIRVGLSQNRISYLEKHPDEISIRQLFSWCSVLELDLQLGERDTSAVNHAVEW